jgi:hypothetical protein
VALLEGGALRLSVVGEDDDLVRARSVRPRPSDAPELLVELAQRLHRVGALEARMVGDLVVAGEGGIHRGASAHHVGQDAEDDEVADDHAHRAAHQRIDAATMAARAHVAAGRARGRRDLQHDLPQEEHERARDVEAVARNAGSPGSPCARPRSG